MPWRIKLKSILIVEDDYQLQNFYKSFLEIRFKELKVFQAFDGEEALSCCSRTDHTAILSDIEMPNMGGIEFYQRLKNKLPELAERVAFISGSITGENLTFIKQENRPYLLKPHKLQPYEDLIHSLIVQEEESFVTKHGHECKRRFTRKKIKEPCQLSPVSSRHLFNEPLVTETIDYSEGGISINYVGSALPSGEKCIVDIKALDIAKKSATVAWVNSSEDMVKAGLMWV